MSGPIYDVTVDYYAALGVGKSATEEEIRDAYRRLAKRLHPDVNPNNPHATEHFKQLEKAYAVLKNALIRRDYDNARSAHLNPQPEPAAAVAEQYFNCPHCQTPNVMPLEGLTIQSLCGNCHQPLLGPLFQTPRPVNDTSPPPFSHASHGGIVPEVVVGQRSSPSRKSQHSSRAWQFSLVPLAIAVLATVRMVSCIGTAPTDNTPPAKAKERKRVAASGSPERRLSRQPLRAEDVQGSWTGRWKIPGGSAHRGYLNWDLLLRENGSFVLMAKGVELTGEPVQWPNYSGTWHVSVDQLVLSKPISIPSITNAHVETDKVTIVNLLPASMLIGYGDGETITLERSYGHPSMVYIPSEAEQHRALMEEATLSRLWTYSMTFNFQRNHGDGPTVPLDINTRHKLSPHGEKVLVVDDGVNGKALKVNRGRIAVDTGSLADQEDWTLSLCFKPESLAVESILYGEMDKAGSDLFDIILSREGHVYLAVWNEGHKPEPWQKTLLTTKRCEVGKWVGLLLTQRDGKVYGHVNQDSVNIDMQVSSRRSSQTDIGRKFQGVIDEVYVAGHRMSSDAYAELPARTLGPQ